MGTGVRGIEGLRLRRPGTRGELRRWVGLYTGLYLPERAVCPEHQTPLDYLAYSFFESQEGGGDVVVWACRGGGKTMVGAVATLLDLLFKPGVQVRILGGSREQSEKMYEYLCGLVERSFSDQVKGEMRRRGFRMKNGSRVEILAQSMRAVRGMRVQKLRCDEVELFDPEVWKAAQLTTRGLTRIHHEDAKRTKLHEGLNHGGHGVHGGIEPRRGDGTKEHEGNDEIRMTNDEGGIEEEEGVERVARGCVEVFSTMHRAGGLMQGICKPGIEGRDCRRKMFTWCIWDVMARCHGNRKCAGCGLWEECQGRAKEKRFDGFVSVEDVVSMKERVSRETWENEMLCFLPRVEGRVFGAFDHKVHMREMDLTRGQPAAGETVMVGDRILRVERVVAGVDFGWQAFVCLWMCVLRDEKGRRVVWVLREYVEGQRTLERHVEAMKAKPVRAAEGDAWAPAVVYCDVAGKQHDAHSGKTSEAVLREAGFVVKSRGQRVEDGIGMIMELIDPAMNSAGPRFFVSAACPKVIAALEGYRRKEPGGKPEKDGEHDHVMDALRYAVVGLEGRSGGMEVGVY